MGSCDKEEILDLWMDVLTPAWQTKHPILKEVLGFCFSFVVSVSSYLGHVRLFLELD